MKLRYHPDSPFVRKVLLVAYECGLLKDIELVPSAAHPVQRDMTVVPENPLGQVPSLQTDDGLHIADSRVICEYLDTMAGGGLIPVRGNARWQALANQSLADGLMLSAVQARYERLVRPAEKQWDDWYQGHMAKIASALAFFEANTPTGAGKLDIGSLTLAAALGYLDHRYKDAGWREEYARLANWYAEVSGRPSIQHIQMGVSLLKAS